MPEGAFLGPEKPKVLVAEFQEVLPGLQLRAYEACRASSAAWFAKGLNGGHRMDEISANVPDWSRERLQKFMDPSRQLLRHIRAYQQLRGNAIRWGALRRKWHLLMYRLWTIVTGADIPLNARLGGGLLLPHPNGIVIHPDAVVGPNCLIFQQVTLGVGGRSPGAPRLGGHVDVGAGAKILGGVTVGDHARIGANAVVLDNVPDGALAVGVPARLIPVQPSSPQRVESGNVV
jgi:serine O-acetyltransferase